jgi:hypothetical protein
MYQSAFERNDEVSVLRLGIFFASFSRRPIGFSGTSASGGKRVSQHLATAGAKSKPRRKPREGAMKGKINLVALAVAA